MYDCVNFYNAKFRFVYAKVIPIYNWKYTIQVGFGGIIILIINKKEI